MFLICKFHSFNKKKLRTKILSFSFQFNVNKIENGKLDILFILFRFLFFNEKICREI